MNTIGLEKQLAKMNQGLIKSIQEQIEALECEIEKIIKSDESLKEQAKQIQSVPGVGPITCWTMIAKTEGFKTITEPRKMHVIVESYPLTTSLEHRLGDSPGSLLMRTKV
jgi:hypothetical protein